MPRRKPKPEKVVQERIKANLDSILLEENLEIESLTVDNLPRMKTTEVLDFQTQIQSTGTDSKDLLESLVKFYVDENLIDESDFIVYKKKIDAMNVASMMLQLKTAQHAITKLVEEIDLGNTAPRMFEVLAQLQSQIMQMSKDHQAYLDKTEASYKNLRKQLETKVSSGSVPLQQNPSQDGSFETIKNPEQGSNSSLRVRGTKNLMEGLRDILGTEIQDVKVEEVNENAVVNARQKASQDASKNVYDNGESTFEIDDELFQ